MLNFFFHSDAAIYNRVYLAILKSCACLSLTIGVDKIAPLFGLDSMRLIWLVKKQGNLAVFPRSGSGRFEGHLIQPGDVYEVKGHCASSNGGSSSGVQCCLHVPSTSRYMHNNVYKLSLYHSTLKMY